MTQRNFSLAALAIGLLAVLAAPAARAGEAEALQRASDRGRLIYAYDQAAWVSTDEMLRLLPDPHAAGVQGYVVEPAGDGVLRAVYFHLDGEAARAVFTADVRGRKIVASHVLTATDDAGLSPLATRLMRAEKAAQTELERRQFAPCADAPFNTVALPPETPDGPAAVYFLTPQAEAEKYPAGGHYEIDVVADGSIAYARPFTRSCLTLGGEALPDGAQAAAAWVTHVLDPTPTEIHVFLSLSMGRPVFVGTAHDRVWRVDGDRIAPAENKVEK